MVARIQTKSVTSDSNAGDDSGGTIVFSTKPEAGSIATALTLGSDQSATFNSTVIAPTMTLSRSSSNSPNVEPVLLFDNTDTAIGANENIGSIRFTTSGESSGSDANLESGRIACFSESGHGSTTNASALAFYTASSEAASSNERMRIGSSGEIQIGGTTNAGFIDFDGSNLQFNTQRNPNTGTFVNTGRAHTSITMFDGNGTAANSYIRFLTTNANNTGATERMRIDSTGNVGIGTSAMSDYDASARDLVIDNGSGDTGITIKSASTHSGLVYFADGTSGDEKYRGFIGYDHYGEALRLGSGGAERVRIDSSGHVFVAKTSSALATVGSELLNDGRIVGTADGQTVLLLNRKSSDGNIIEFYKDGSIVGYISYRGAELQIGQGNAALQFSNGSDAIVPANESGSANDDAIDLGLSNARFDDIFATNGTIQTSDENEKQDIASMTTAELAVGKRLSTLFKTFRWKSKVTEKADKARTHSGIIAQEVKAAFEAEGLDATKYALFCSDTWTNDDGDEQTRMGVRYPELLSFIASYNESRFTAIEARLTALEGE
jgi:hypothetical protein